METENKYKNIYRIKSARKLGYDYTSDGWYFVTICAKNMEQFFGNITDGKMNLSEIGKIIKKYWLEIPKHFPFVELDEFSIMPNHNHGIIGINGFAHRANGDELCRRDGDLSRLNHAREYKLFGCANRDAINRVSTGGDDMDYNRDAMNCVTGGVTGRNNPMGKNGLGEIIRWYKGRCKFEIGKMGCDNFAWQPRFYDRIIRNEKELNKIRKYIFENVLKWEFDKNNIENF